MQTKLDTNLEMLRVASVASAGVPITFDFHHHRFCTGDMTEEQAFKAAIATWPKGVRPQVMNLTVTLSAQLQQYPVWDSCAMCNCSMFTKNHFFNGHMSSQSMMGMIAHTVSCHAQQAQQGCDHSSLCNSPTCSQGQFTCFATHQKLKQCLCSLRQGLAARLAQVAFGSVICGSMPYRNSS